MFVKTAVSVASTAMAELGTAVKLDCVVDTHVLPLSRKIKPIMSAIINSTMATPLYNTNRFSRTVVNAERFSSDSMSGVAFVAANAASIDAIN